MATLKRVKLPNRTPLKKGEGGRGLQWTTVRSSWIEALRYDSVRMTCDMMTKKGKRYRYSNVPQKEYATWRQAASKGRNFWRRITYTYGPARPF